MSLEYQECRQGWPPNALPAAEEVTESGSYRFLASGKQKAHRELAVFSNSWNTAELWLTLGFFLLSSVHTPQLQ